MKTRIQKFSALGLTLLFFSFTANAQWGGNEVFENVDDPSNYTTIELASMDPNLSTFVNLVKQSGLAASMSTTGAHTVFIPTNAAFDDISIERYQELTNPKNQTKLMEFVKYHIMPTKNMKIDFEDDQVMTGSSPDEITVSKDIYDNVFIGGAKIIRSDIEASNGVIHIVNDIIVPNRSIFMVD